MESDKPKKPLEFTLPPKPAPVQVEGAGGVEAVGEPEAPAESEPQQVDSDVVAQVPVPGPVEIGGPATPPLPDVLVDVATRAAFADAIEKCQSDAERLVRALTAWETMGLTVKARDVLRARLQQIAGSLEQAKNYLAGCS